jgi:hypothetical protein
MKMGKQTVTTPIFLPITGGITPVGHASFQGGPQPDLLLVFFNAAAGRRRLALA